MKTTNNLFETGASTHAVNDLILFTDNTRELAEYRDKIYIQKVNNDKEGKEYHLPSAMQLLYVRAVNQYKKEFPDTDRRYFYPLGSGMAVEFCSLYANDFASWKEDHNY